MKHSTSGEAGWHFSIKYVINDDIKNQTKKFPHCHCCKNTFAELRSLNRAFNWRQSKHSPIDSQASSLKLEIFQCNLEQALPFDFSALAVWRSEEYFDGAHMSCPSVLGSLAKACWHGTGVRWENSGRSPYHTLEMGKLNY